MTVSIPKIFVQFEPKNGLKVEQLCAFNPASVESAPVVHNIKIAKSFGVIRFLIQAPSTASIFALLDGVVATQSLGPLPEYRIVLETDYETHVAQFVISDLWSTSIHLVAHNHFNYKLKYFWPKWSIAELKSAHLSLKSLVGKDGPNSNTKLLSVIADDTAIPDLETSRVVAHTMTFELAHLLSSITQEELREVFAANRKTGIDVSHLMKEIKSNPQMLELSDNGPFHIDGKNYTTAILVKRTQKSTSIDLSDLMAVLKVLRMGLIQIDLAAASQKINWTISNFRQRYSASMERNTLSASIRNIVRMQTHSAKLKKSKEIILHLLLITNKHAGWNSEIETKLGMELGWRDFDLFQNFAAIKTEEFIQTSEKSGSIVSNPYVRGAMHDLINPNIAGGTKWLRKYLTGWRDTTIQCSDYRPDLVLLYNKNTPIIIDAKFRTSSSPNAIATQDSIKEVQAYLDEYSRNSAIIIVPSFPPELIFEGRDLGKPEAELKTRPRIALIKSNAHKKVIVLLELRADETPYFNNNLHDALLECYDAEMNKDVILPNLAS